MRLLLDTHILLWWLNDDPLLPSTARTYIADPENEVFVSSLSVWEIAVKSQLGKLDAEAGVISAAIAQSRFMPLPFTIKHAVEITRLPHHHRDPFDRALIAQARTEPLRLLTHDSLVAAYGNAVILV